MKKIQGYSVLFPAKGTVFNQNPLFFKECLVEDFMPPKDYGLWESHGGSLVF